MWREWIEFFKYLSFKPQNSAVFKWLHMENCSGSPCTHPQDSVGAQTWDCSGMRKREERRISMKRKGLRKERTQFRNIHKLVVAQWRSEQRVGQLSLSSCSIPGISYFFYFTKSERTFSDVVTTPWLFQKGRAKGGWAVTTFWPFQREGPGKGKQWGPLGPSWRGGPVEGK